MDEALIVSSSRTGAALFQTMLESVSYKNITIATTGGSARSLLLKNEYYLIIINAPLSDESGESLAKLASSKELGQTILVTAKPSALNVTSLELSRVNVMTKPINRATFLAAVSAIRAISCKMLKLYEENLALKRMLDDIRIVDRAKCILISVLHMSEKEAHRFIEKQAMDMRGSRRMVAEGVLRTYES